MVKHWLCWFMLIISQGLRDCTWIFAVPGKSQEPLDVLLPRSAAWLTLQGCRCEYEDHCRVSRVQRWCPTHRCSRCFKSFQIVFFNDFLITIEVSEDGSSDPVTQWPSDAMRFSSAQYAGLRFPPVAMPEWFLEITDQAMHPVTHFQLSILNHINMCFLWCFLWFFHVLSLFFTMFSYVLFASGNHLWEKHIWPDSVQATAGNSRLWTGGRVDVWPRRYRCHDVLLRTARTHAIWICTRMVPTMLLGWNIREMHFRASAEDIQIFDMFHDILRFDMCASFWKVSWHCDDEPLFDATGVVISNKFSNTLRISKPMFLLWRNCGLGIDGYNLVITVMSLVAVIDTSWPWKTNTTSSQHCQLASISSLILSAFSSFSLFGGLSPTEVGVVCD